MGLSAARPGCALPRIRIAQAAIRRSDEAASAPMSPGEPITRRRLLQGAGATAVAFGVGGAWPDGSPARADRQARVVVVGAGIAGLGCAHELWRTYAIRAEVYEWSERAGGRIQTLRGHFDERQLV
jgi:monoamine oxidase